MAFLKGLLLIGCALLACSFVCLMTFPQPADGQILLNHIRAVKAGQDPASVPHGHHHGHEHGGHDHGHAHTHGGHDHYHGGHDHGHAHSHGGHDHGHAHSHGGHDHSHGGHDHGHAHSHGGHDHAHDAHEHSHASVQEDSVGAGVNCDGTRTKYDIWTRALGATLVVCAAPVFILPLIPIGAQPHQNEKLLNVLLAFAAGGLLGDVFLHLLPHAMNPHVHGEHDHSHSHSHAHGHDGEHDHTEAMVLGLWVIAGIMIFFLLEKAMRNYSGESHGHSHSHSHAPVKDTNPAPSPRPSRKKEADKAAVDKASKVAKSASASPADEGEKIKVAGYLNLIADFSHNFTDGLAIGASYLVSDKVGFSTTVAILLHEVPHEIGDFAILVQSGFSKRKAMLAQFSTAIGAVLGTVIGLLAKDVADSTAWVLPLTAGGFIYIATTTVFPALLDEPGLWQTVMETLAICIGVALMVLIAYFE